MIPGLQPFGGNPAALRPPAAGGGYAEAAVTFDGADFLDRATLLSGLADSKTGTVFGKASFANAATGDEYLLSVGATAQRFHRQSNGTLRVYLQNDTPGYLGQVATSSAYGAGELSFLASVNADGVSTSRIFIYAGGSWSAQASYVFPDAVIGWTNTADSHVGARNSGLGAIVGDVFRVAFWPGVFVDLTSAGVRDLFLDSATGALEHPDVANATLGDPIVLFDAGLQGAAGFNAGTNLGTGGDFVMSGSVVDA